MVVPETESLRKSFWSYIGSVLDENPKSPELAYLRLSDKLIKRAELYPFRPRYFKRVAWSTEHQKDLTEMFSNLLKDRDFYKKEVHASR
jgi:hypothetical protein